MASSSLHPPDIVTNPDRTKPDEVLRVLSPLRARRTPVLVNAPVVTWHLGASSLRPLPSFDSVLSDSVVSATSGVSSVGSTVRALRGALLALSGDAEAESVQEVSMEGLLADGGEGDAPLPLHDEALQPPLQQATAPLPPPHRFFPTLFSVSVADLGLLEREERASIDTSSPVLEEEEEEEEQRQEEWEESPTSSASPELEEEGEEEEGDPLANPPTAAHQVNGWTPHVLSPVTEVTESGLSRGTSMMSMLSLGNPLEVGVARRVRVAAVGNGDRGGGEGWAGRGVEEEEEEEEEARKPHGRPHSLDEGQLVREWPQERVVRRRPAFYAADRDEGEEWRRSHKDWAFLPHAEQEKGGCRLCGAGPGHKSSAETGSDNPRTAAAGQAANGETVNGEKPAVAGRGEGRDGWRGFCVKLRLDKVKEKAGRLRRKMKGKVGRVLATRVLARVL
jgi:hypothetical protein